MGTGEPRERLRKGRRGDRTTARGLRGERGVGGWGARVGGGEGRTTIRRGGGHLDWGGESERQLG